MPNFSTLNTANSALRVAQVNLGVTAHNVANAEIPGFSRQRIIQNDFAVRNIGRNQQGHLRQIGLGVDRQPVEQIRSNFFDMEFRVHNSRMNFYSIKANVGAQIETILGELDGAYSMQVALQDIWESMQELSINLDGIEAREFFISTAVVFIEKAQQVFDELFEQQIDLDMQIRNAVNEINDLVSEIDVLNRRIAFEETVGDNANDLRDERNRLLDSLSNLIPITTTTDPRTGWLNINTLNNFLLSSGTQNVLGFKQVSPDYPFVEPVFTRSAGILPASTPPGQYIPLIDYRHAMQTGRGHFARGMNHAAGNDSGTLFALLASRGAMPATYAGMEAIFRPVPPEARPVPWLDISTIEQELAVLAGDNPEDFNFAVFQGAVGTYHAAWQAFYNTVPEEWRPPAPPNPADFPDLNTAEGQMALVRAFQVYQVHLENDMRNINRLYPSRINDPAGFEAAVASPGSPGHQELMRLFDAAEFNYYHAAWSKQFATIPRTMMHLDTIVNSVVRLVNDTVAPVGTDGHWDFENAPVDLFNNPSLTPVFVRGVQSHPPSEHMPRFDPITGVHNPGVVGNPLTMYTTRNLMVNPALRLDGGWNLLALSYTSDREDTTLMQEMVANWQSNEGPYAIEVPRGSGNFFNIQQAYNNFVTDLAISTREANTTLNTQFLQTTQADNRRNSIMSVSMDEEMSSMLTFQFAYQAAARLFNMVDSMIDTIVNRMGRVGL